MSMNPSSITPSNITGAILAGGRGRRMGGLDKGLIKFQGIPLVEHVLQALRPQVSTIMLSANRNQTVYTRYGYPVVADLITGYAGPLAGFAALLRECETAWLMVVPCDGPSLPADLTVRLNSARLRAGADIAVAHDGQRLQPVHVLLGKHLLPDLEAWLTGGGRKIDLWYARHHMITVNFSDQSDSFINLNRPGDKTRLEVKKR